MALSSFSVPQVAVATVLLVMSSFWVEIARAALFTDPSQLPNGVQYDFIVIGGEEPRSSWLLVLVSSADEMVLTERPSLMQAVPAVVSLRTGLRKNLRRRCC